MAQFKSLVTILFAGTIIAGCAPGEQSLFSSSAEDQTQSAARAPAEAPSSAPSAMASAPPRSSGKTGAVPAPPPRLGNGTAKGAQITTSGTFVGAKIAQLRSELERLKSGVGGQSATLQQIREQSAENSRQYYGTVAGINSRLQIGTTPGNPVLVNHWNGAQARLARIDADIARLNGLANEVASKATMSSYLLETTRAAYGLTGAVDEDHRQLAVVEDEINRTVVMIDRLLNQLSEDINRQINYVANERNNLTTLSLAIKNGELLGTNLQNRVLVAASPPPQSLQSMPITPVRATPLPPMGRDTKVAKAAPRKKVAKKRRPLVVIRFDRPNVAFEQSLYTAVSTALDRRPTARFDLVAVAPNGGSAAQTAMATNRSKRNAESVLRSLSEMGLPLDRIRLSAKTSEGARANEVHVYVQ